ncbi:hypothetical protein M316_0055 [Nitrincola phage 1M3-16]|uniref:hypothetical protein n=1 Tax=Nitrincola phage 1M3-16 TaxID=1472912 RepID=UPI000444D4A0|nr:hypothetical protein GJ22_gp097 [Nitrincola phage 1M3-16]AHX01120.1 hypothetical protein M316_0055 [Nitrincola phage 1M3-16]
MKTMKDAVIELKGDLNNLENFQRDSSFEVEGHHEVVCTDSTWNAWNPHWSDGGEDWYSVGTVAEFKKLAEEMKMSELNVDYIKKTSIREIMEHAFYEVYNKHGVCLSGVDFETYRERKGGKDSVRVVDVEIRGEAV